MNDLEYTIRYGWEDSGPDPTEIRSKVAMAFANGTNSYAPNSQLLADGAKRW